MTSIKELLSNASGFHSYTSATEEQIDQAENELKVRFSLEYKKYVSAFGFASLDGHELTGVCPFKRLNVVDITKEERPKNPAIPLEWYVVEQLHIDDVVIWQNSAGEIYQSLPGTEPARIASSLADYLKL